MTTPFDWAAEGFRRRPAPRRAPRGQVLFRAWGGRSRKQGSPDRIGVCFSSQRPASRAEAEQFYAVFEWGNACQFVTDFIVPTDTLLWWGHVDPGDERAVHGRSFGVQVFVENPAAQLLIPARTVGLADDLGGARIHTGKPPRVDS